MLQSSTSKEADFPSLFKQLRNGRRSIDSFLGALGFEPWLKCRACRYDFLIFENSYDRDHFILECRLKIMEAAPGLDPEKTPNAAAFFGFAKKVVHNTYLDALRDHNKHFRHEWTRSDEPMEVLSAAAPDVNFDGRYFLGRFMEFIKVYRPERQFAIMLWLFDGCSYQQVVDALSEEGFECSRVTVGKWVTKSLDAFRVSLGLPPPETPEKQSRGRAGSRPERGGRQSVAGPERSGDEQNST